MKTILLWTFSLLLLLSLAYGQYKNPPLWPQESRFPKMPNGRSPEQMIVEAHLKSNLEDLDEILTLTEEVEELLEQQSPTRKSDELRRRADRIEKLAKSVRGRLRWF